MAHNFFKVCFNYLVTRVLAFRTTSGKITYAYLYSQLSTLFKCANTYYVAVLAAVYILSLGITSGLKDSRMDDDDVKKRHYCIKIGGASVLLGREI